MGEDENTCMRQDDRPDKSQKASKIDNRKPKIFLCLFIYLFYFYSIFIECIFPRSSLQRFLLDSIKRKIYNIVILKQFST